MRLIDADALKEEVNKKNVVGRFNTLLLIDNAPTVEPKQGEWIIIDDFSNGEMMLKCPECNGTFRRSVFPNFCEFCGAKMKGVQNDIS